MSEEKCIHNCSGYCEAHNDSCTNILDCYFEQLQTAKEENEKLTQQNKQMRENINNIKNLCNEDWEDMTVDKFQNQLLQALKGVE